MDRMDSTNDRAHSGMVLLDTQSDNQNRSGEGHQCRRRIGRRKLGNGVRSEMDPQRVLYNQAGLVLGARNREELVSCDCTAEPAETTQY